MSQKGSESITHEAAEDLYEENPLDLSYGSFIKRQKFDDFFNDKHVSDINVSGHRFGGNDSIISEVHLPNEVNLDEVEIKSTSEGRDEFILQR